MRVTTVTVQYGRTVNLDNYESARLDCHLTAEVEDGENAEDVLDATWEIVKRSLKVRAMPLIEARNARAAQGLAAVQVAQRVGNGGK